MTSVTGNTQSHHHKTYLGDGRESEYAFDIRLDTRYYRCKERSKRPHVSYVRKKLRSCFDIQREKSRNEEHPGYDHSGRMYKGRNRSRALHRVGKPYMQREHCRFTRAAYEYQSERPSSCRYSQERNACGRTERTAVRSGQSHKVESLRVERKHQYADKEA